MISIGKVENYSDLLQIRELNQNNLINNLSRKDELEYGFVTLNYNMELLKDVNKIQKSIVARDNDKIVGYAIVIDKTVYGLHKLFDDLIDRLSTISFNSKKLKNVNYALVGQLCIKKEYRGMGIVKKMISETKVVNGWTALLMKESIPEKSCAMNGRVVKDRIRIKIFFFIIRLF